jgi:hypothetical protein
MGYLAEGGAAGEIEKRMSLLAADAVWEPKLLGKRIGRPIRRHPCPVRRVRLLAVLLDGEEWMDITGGFMGWVSRVFCICWGFGLQGVESFGGKEKWVARLGSG